jgi:phospholipid/cholesterol/gamma-HCH transport system substrate-binding protein
MKRTIRVKWGELKVGLLITFAIAALLWASFTGGGTSVFDPKISYAAYFTNVNGLVTGAPVWISGVEVGNVSSIIFVNLDSVRQIEVKIKVKKKVANMVTMDATLKLGTIGFLGDKYIEIIPGTLSLPEMEPGMFIKSAQANDMSAMIGTGEKAMTNFRDLAGNLTTITDKIKRGEGTTGKLFTNDTLYYEMTKMVSSMTLLINELQKNQERLTSSVENVAVSLDSITSNLNSKRGTAGKLLADPGLYDNLHSSASRIDSILSKVNRGEGTAGALVNDDSLYVEIKNLVTRVNNLVTDIQKDPRKYFKFSVF